MKYEWRQSQDDVPKNTEYHDGNGDIRDDDVAAEYKYDKSGKEEKGGDEEEGRQCFDKLCALRARYSRMCARTWAWGGKFRRVS